MAITVMAIVFGCLPANGSSSYGEKNRAERLQAWADDVDVVRRACSKSIGFQIINWAALSVDLLDEVRKVRLTRRSPSRLAKFMI